jgi:energy-coupling factor transport system ATP-binding protein
MVDKASMVSGLSLQDVSVIRMGQKQPLLQGLSLRASPGSVTVFCGPNGCGKSSLFQALTRAHAGISFVGSFELSEVQHPPRQILSSDLGYLPQSQEFVTGDCVHTFIQFSSNRSIAGDAQMQLYLQHFSVQELLHRRIESLSGGQWKRVQCAAHFGVASAVRILDEPEGSLDGQGLNQLVSAIQLAKTAGEIILVASHSRAFMRDVADDVIYLNGGRVCWQTSKDEFVEHGPINELSY